SLPIEVEEVREPLRWRIAFDRRAARLAAHALAQRWLLVQPVDGLSQRVGIARRDEQPSVPVLHDLRDPADATCDHGNPTCEALEIHQAGRFLPNRWTCQAVGGLHERLYVAAIAEEEDAAAEFEGFGQLLQATRFGSAAHHPNDDVGRELRCSREEQMAALLSDQMRYEQHHESLFCTEFAPHALACAGVRSKPLRVDEVRTGRERRAHAFAPE